jgi:hypothetical protein
MKVTVIELPEAKRQALETLLTPSGANDPRKADDKSPLIVVDDNGLAEKLIDRLVRHDRVSILTRPGVTTYTGLTARIDMLKETDPGNETEPANQSKSGSRFEMTPSMLPSGKIAVRSSLEYKWDDAPVDDRISIRETFTVEVDSDQTFLVLNRSPQNTAFLAAVTVRLGDWPEKLVAPVPTSPKPKAKEPITARPMRRQNPDSNANAQDGFLHWRWQGKHPPTMLIPTSPKTAKVLPLSDSH